MPIEQQIIHFDLHSHTVLSDGRNTPEEMVQQAHDVGLDYLAITDHNRAMKMSTLKRLSDVYDMGLLPGFEYTILQAHFLILGVNPERVQSQLTKRGLSEKTLFKNENDTRMKDMLMWASDEGGVAIVAHPGYPWKVASLPMKQVRKLHDDGLIQGAEVHNRQLKQFLREKNLGFLYKLVNHQVEKFCSHHGIPQFADSDAHSTSILGGRCNQAQVNFDTNPDQLLSELRHQSLDVTHKKI